MAPLRMGEYLLDHHRIFDANDDLDGGAALTIGLHTFGRRLRGAEITLETRKALSGYSVMLLATSLYIIILLPNYRN